MAAQNGTMQFRGKNSTYTVDFYAPDAVGTVGTFNASGLSGATSPNYWKAPETVILEKVTIAASPTAVGATLTLSGALYVGKTLRWANQLSSLSNPMTHQIVIPAGEQVGFLQF